MLEPPASAAPGGPSRAGWFPDPTGRHEFRFHNGSRWTADVADDGRRFVDHDGASPGSPGPPGSASPAPARPNRLATASVVCGILSIVTGLLPFVFVFGGLAAITALALGWTARRRSTTGADGRGRATIGLVTGSLGIATTVVGGLLTVVLVDAIDRFENPGAHELGETSCTQDGRSWTAAGEITNLEADERDYLLTIEFRRAGTDNPQVRTRVEVDDVAPDGTGRFEVRRVVDLDEVECRVTDVDGPAPFGIDIGR